METSNFGNQQLFFQEVLLNLIQWLPSSTSLIKEPEIQYRDVVMSLLTKLSKAGLEENLKAYKFKGLQYALFKLETKHFSIISKFFKEILRKLKIFKYIDNRPNYQAVNKEITFINSNIDQIKKEYIAEMQKIETNSSNSTNFLGSQKVEIELKEVEEAKSSLFQNDSEDNNLRMIRMMNEFDEMKKVFNDINKKLKNQDNKFQEMKLQSEKEFQEMKLKSEKEFQEMKLKSEKEFQEMKLMCEKDFQEMKQEINEINDVIIKSKNILCSYNNPHQFEKKSQISVIQIKDFPEALDKVLFHFDSKIKKIEIFIDSIDSIDYLFSIRTKTITNYNILSNILMATMNSSDTKLIAEYNKQLMKVPKEYQTFTPVKCDVICENFLLIINGKTFNEEFQLLNKCRKYINVLLHKDDTSYEFNSDEILNYMNEICSRIKTQKMSDLRDEIKKLNPKNFKFVISTLALEINNALYQNEEIEKMEPARYAKKLLNKKKFIRCMYIGDWGLGIGDWGLGIGPNPQSPIPNPLRTILKLMNIFYNLMENKKTIDNYQDLSSFCFNILITTLSGDNKQLPFPEDFKGKTYPIFVTWYKGENLDLRGCIGTFHSDKLEKVLPKYSLISALEDNRFRPVTLQEVKSLHVGISLLCNFKDVDYEDWEVGVHGLSMEITIKSISPNNIDKTYSSTFLPEVAGEQGWNKYDTIENLIEKAGFRGEMDDVIKIAKFTRYESIKTKMSFNEYKEIEVNQEIAKLVNKSHLK